MTPLFDLSVHPSVPGTYLLKGRPGHALELDVTVMFFTMGYDLGLVPPEIVAAISLWTSI